MCYVWQNNSLGKTEYCAIQLAQQHYWHNNTSSAVLPVIYMYVHKHKPLYATGIRYFFLYLDRFLYNFPRLGDKS